MFNQLLTISLWQPNMDKDLKKLGNASEKPTTVTLNICEDDLVGGLLFRIQEKVSTVLTRLEEDKRAVAERVVLNWDERSVGREGALTPMSRVSFLQRSAQEAVMISGACGHWESVFIPKEEEVEVELERLCAESDAEVVEEIRKMIQGVEKFSPKA